MEDMFNFGKYDRQDKEKLLKELTEDLAKPEPVVTEPVVTEPVVTEPVVTEPVTTIESVITPVTVNYITSADLEKVVLEFTETIKKLTVKETENVKEKKYKY